MYCHGFKDLVTLSIPAQLFLIKFSIPIIPMPIRASIFDYVSYSLIWWHLNMEIETDIDIYPATSFSTHVSKYSTANIISEQDNGLTDPKVVLLGLKSVHQASAFACIKIIFIGNLVKIFDHSPFICSPSRMQKGCFENIRYKPK